MTFPSMKRLLREADALDNMAADDDDPFDPKYRTYVKASVKEILRQDIDPPGGADNVDIGAPIESTKNPGIVPGLDRPPVQGRMTGGVLNQLQTFLPAGSIGKFLGAGATMNVYEFTPDNGPLMAVKIGNDRTKPYRSIVKAMDQMDKIHAKHLPKIYGVWAVTGEGDAWTGGAGRLVVLTERLIKLPIKIEKALQSYLFDESAPDFAEFVKRDINIVSYIFEGVTRLSIVIPDLYSIIISKILPQVRKHWRFRARAPDYNRAAAFGGLIENLLSRLYPKLKQKIKNLTKFSSTTWQTAWYAQQYLPFAGHTDPTRALRYYEYLERTGLKTFYVALDTLQHKYGVEWHDLKTENIMMRPSDKSIVVADIGAFGEW